MNWPEPVPPALKRLRILSVSFTLQSLAKVRLPEFLGSTLRGGLASSFRTMVCTYNRASCDGCPVQQSCPYPLLFETPAATGEQEIRRMRDIPHPIVLLPPRNHPHVFETGELLPFSALLIGKKVSIFPYLVFAVSEMAHRGLGTARAPFSLTEVRDLNSRSLFDPISGKLQGQAEIQTLEQILGRTPYSDRLILEIHSPLRIKWKGTFMTRKFEIEAFLRNACRRLWALLYAHEDVKGEKVDFRPLFEEVPFPVVEDSRLSWKSCLRYSNRQKKKIGIGGLVGRVSLSHVPLPWWVILSSAAQVGVGKGTVMGLGEYKLRPKEVTPPCQAFT